MLGDLPILGICGWSGSGKTTLIEQILPALRQQGLKVVVVKHDAHGIDVDRPGKDSDRFFRAGASVLLQGPQEEFLRAHRAKAEGLAGTLWELARRHDLVLVEGHKSTPLPKLWLLGDGESQPPPQVQGVRAVLPRDSSRAGRVLALLKDWLPGQWVRAPVFGCILIGGESHRMGAPKHLIRANDQTWLERTAELLQRVADTVAIVGAGVVPASVPSIERLPDVPDAKGPVAGILAAMRWAPRASWLVAACDLPDLSLDALRWLLSTRAPGVWATLPRLPGSPGVEPLLAHFDFRALPLLEGLVARGEFCPARITASDRVVSPAPPPDLLRAWRNVNTPAELAEAPDRSALNA